MAELVNQRIQETINELEQMRRTSLYDDEEIREISRKRKEFEYKIQRRMKSKEDYVHYIAYELALLEDIRIRRKETKLYEKKQEIEYAIAKRVNKMFKQFIYRFQDDIEVYFQYIKFCQSVGFQHAVSGIIGQMLQHYSDKPKMWQLASKWECDEQNNLPNARSFLLKGIHRHPDAEILYLDLLKVEILLASKAETDEEKEKQIQRADVVWKNGYKNINNVAYLIKVLELAMKCNIESIITEVKQELWAKKDEKEVWAFIASKELEGCHWEEIEDLIQSNEYPKNLRYFISVYEEALLMFPDEKLCTKYIHQLLGLNDSVCSHLQKLSAVKNAWMFGHEHGLLSNDMYEFGIEMLKLENELTSEDMIKILEEGCTKNASRYLWKEKLLLHKSDENKMVLVLQDASKILKHDDMLHLWNTTLDNIESSNALKLIYKKFQNCENTTLMAIKPKLLRKNYEKSGIKAAREMYEDFIRTPPLQQEVHTTMIDIEHEQTTKNVKLIRKCYEGLVQHQGSDCVDVWTKYIEFETKSGSPQLSPAVYRRAVQSLKKDLVDEFIRVQSLAKIN